MPPRSAHQPSSGTRRRDPAGPPAGSGPLPRGKIAAGLGFAGAAVLAALAGTPLLNAVDVPGLPAPGPLLRFGMPATRAVLDVAAVAALGLALLPRLLTGMPRNARRVLSTARRASVSAALVWMSSALLLAVLYNAELSSTTPSAEQFIDYVTGVPAGTASALAAGCAGLSAALGIAGLIRGGAAAATCDDLRIAVTALGLLPMPLTGHATDRAHQDFGMIAVQLHVLAAAVWAGGLLALVLVVAPRRGLLAVALPRFSALATAAIAVVAGSGLFNGLAELLSAGAGWAGLLTTGYGRVVLLKTVLLAGLAGFGWFARNRLLPAVSRHRRTALVSWATGELAVLGLACGLGAVLARAPVS